MERYDPDNLEPPIPAARVPMNADAVVAQFAAELVRQLPHDVLSVALLDNERRTFERFVLAAAGPLSVRSGERWPQHATVLGRVVSSGQPVRADDLAADARFADPIGRRWVAAGLHSLLSVPLCVDGTQRVGTLTLFSRRVGAFRAEHEPVLLAMADAMAPVVEQCYQHARSRRLAVGEERSRIARTMYDSLAHDLADVLVQLEAVERRADRHAAWSDELHKARTMLRCALENARRSLWNLQPSALEEQPLPEALRDELQHWEALHGTPARLFVRGEAMLPLAVETAVLRVAQEALLNVATHAQARELRVELEYTPDEIRLLVSDDGNGFVAPADCSTTDVQSGLGVMHARTSAVGGRLTVSSWPANGTRVEARFPRSGPVLEPLPVDLSLAVGVDRALRALVVEPQAIVRQGLVALLSRIDGMLVVGDAPDGYKALELARRTAPDLVLLEMQLPGMDGAATVEQLLALHPQTLAVILTSSDAADSLTRSVQAGARGYLLKDSGFEQLRATLYAVLRGEVVIERRLTRHLAERFAHLYKSRHPHDSLSERELEVLRLMVEGRRNRAIADALLVSEHTVKTHIANIFQKLGVNDRAAAVYTAIQRNVGGLAIAGLGEVQAV
jgi:DNA-binding NarL/FixJ family response regulator/signal transduction histidine kinase